MIFLFYLNLLSLANEYPLAQSEKIKKKFKKERIKNDPPMAPQIS